MDRIKKNSITRGALVLGIGAFLSKLLGAIYRVPLTNIIGDYGLGLYQMVFPVYCVMLDFSGLGVPSALSKLISSTEQNNIDYKANLYLKTSLRLFSILGLIFTVFMCTFSLVISNLQGDKNAYLSYITLSPSIFFVCIISSFRGYFQGKLNMFATASSQVIEQLIKLCFGLVLARVFMPNITLAVAGATLAITISEVVSCVYLYFLYRKNNNCNKSYGKFDVELAKKIVKLCIPITIIGVVIPISQVLDSFLIVNIIKKYSSNAMSLYGLYSGVNLTIINLPISICYGISATLIPIISMSKDKTNRKDKIKKGLLLTLVLSLLAYFFCYYFAEQIIKILFSSFSREQVYITTRLIKISSSAIVFHSLLQSVNGILIGQGKSYSILLGMITGVVVKTIMNIFLLQNPKINIYGSAISLITCYFIALLINLIIVIKKESTYERKKPFGGQPKN